MVYKSFKTLLIPILLFIVLSFSVFGVLSYPLPYSGEWSTHGFDIWGSGAYTFPYVTFDMAINRSQNFTYRDTVLSGSAFPPTAYDWDDDGDVEIISAQGTNLNVYTATTNTLELESSTALGALGSEPSCFTFTEVVTDHSNFCVMNLGNYIYTLYYQNNTIYEYASSALPTGIAIESAFNCFWNPEVYTTPFCVADGHNASANKDYLLMYQADVDDTITLTLVENLPVSDYSIGKMWKPMISDIDYDDVLEIVSYSVDDSAIDTLYIYVHDINATDLTIASDTGFNTGNPLAFSGYKLNYVTNIQIVDVDSATDEEIIFCGSYDTSDTFVCRTYNSDGTTYASDSVVVSSSANEGRLVYADFDGDNSNEIAHIYKGSTQFLIDIYNVEVSMSAPAKSNAVTHLVAGDLVKYMSAAKVNSEDDTFDIIVGNDIFYINSTNGILAESGKNIDTDHVIPVNFNNDAQLDLIGQELNKLDTYTMKAVTSPYVPTYMLNYNDTYDGMIFPYNIVCPGTELQFSGVECVTGEFKASCTYTNSESNQERFAYNCDDGAGLQTGNFSEYNPVFNCTFATAGTYDVLVYLQDNQSTSYYGIGTNITVLATTGISGSTCDIFDLDYAIETGAGGAGDTPSEELDLTGGLGEALLKFLVGIFIIAAFMTLGFKYTHSVVGGGIFSILGLIITVAIGLINIWVVILVGFLMILPILLKIFYSSS